MNYPTEVTLSLETNFSFNLTHTGCLKAPFRDMCDFATIGSNVDLIKTKVAIFHWLEQFLKFGDFVLRSMVTFLGLKIS